MGWLYKYKFTKTKIIPNTDGKIISLIMPIIEKKLITKFDTVLLIRWISFFKAVNVRFITALLVLLPNAPIASKAISSALNGLLFSNALADCARYSP